MNEPPGSADFIMEVGTPTDLATTLHHALPPWIVARTRKRPSTTTPVAAGVAKKRKAFVTNDKGAVISTDFYNERPKQKTVYPKTADERKTSSEQQIHGTNLTCILDTGSDVNLLGRKHLKEFEKLAYLSQLRKPKHL